MGPSVHNAFALRLARSNLWPCIRPRFRPNPGVHLGYDSPESGGSGPRWGSGPSNTGPTEGAGGPKENNGWKEKREEKEKKREEKEKKVLSIRVGRGLNAYGATWNVFWCPCLKLKTCYRAIYVDIAVSAKLQQQQLPTRNVQTRDWTHCQRPQLYPLGNRSMWKKED